MTAALTRPDGGPAFPRPAASAHVGDELLDGGDLGMSLRDWFAASAHPHEIDTIIFKNLSRAAAEAIVGRAHPEEPRDDAGRVDYQLAKARFEASLIAAVRFLVADAMLAERAKGGDK